MISNLDILLEALKVCSFIAGGITLSLIPVIAIIKLGPSPKTEFGANIYGLCLGGVGSLAGIWAGFEVLMHFACV